MGIASRGFHAKVLASTSGWPSSKRARHAGFMAGQRGHAPRLQKSKWSGHLHSTSRQTLHDDAKAFTYWLLDVITCCQGLHAKQCNGGSTRENGRFHMSDRAGHHIGQMNPSQGVQKLQVGSTLGSSRSLAGGPWGHATRARTG